MLKILLFTSLNNFTSLYITEQLIRCSFLFCRQLSD
nr:MAG TPA: hypothetical protein [Caudoviricetes sp.]